MPRKETIKMTEFLSNTKQLIFSSSHDKMMSSMTGGSTKAIVVLQTAPSKLRKRLRLGTTSAMVNVTRTIKVRKTSSPISGCFSASFTELLTDGYSIWMGTKNWIAYPSSTPSAIVSFTHCAKLKVGD